MRTLWTLQSLSVRWQNFKLNFESGLKGNSDVDLSFLETSKRTRRMRAKKRQQQRVISSSEPNDVFVTMTANIGALRDAIHGAQADVAMDAANNDARYGSYECREGGRGCKGIADSRERC